MNTGIILMPPLTSPRRMMEIIIAEKKEMTPNATMENVRKSSLLMPDAENFMGMADVAAPPAALSPNFEAKLPTMLSN